jgi:hypothetical protein
MYARGRRVGARMDYMMLQKLADSAQERADRFHMKYQHAQDNALASKAAGYLNDYFYWIGHANAYRGVLAGLEINAIVEDELDSEGSCP